MTDRRKVSEIKDQIARLEIALPFTDGEMAYNLVRGWIAALRWMLGREDFADRPAGADARDAITANLEALDSLQLGDRLVFPDGLELVYRETKYTLVGAGYAVARVFDGSSPALSLGLNSALEVIQTAIRGGAVILRAEVSQGGGKDA
jgi:hypothetical protein